MLSTPIDLKMIRQQLSEHATEATLAESGKSVRTAQLTLTVAPAPIGHGGWIAAVRNAAFALGGVMLIVFGLVFMPRQPRSKRY